MAQEADQVETVTGVRETMGNAVECPRLRTDDGRSVFIFRLPPDVAIGSRVKVTGVFVHPTTCIGPALRADRIDVL
ncbi:hypothetical protein J5J10_09260 [Ciceribacter sp. L1K23]|uniref:hypothetical protein n=1 Tax=Ciceribacter sp. L1K23 TaxID=2820276 RepID=UPI001B83139F|nr:hypothetical protein [Ciceribacter sp. L1K23]MBR0555866.1 hypothetical protein [Ciceribacter sp. L1K23]